jgi:hypothetical protein
MGRAERQAEPTSLDLQAVRQLLACVLCRFLAHVNCLLQAITLLVEYKATVRLHLPDLVAGLVSQIFGALATFLTHVFGATFDLEAALANRHARLFTRFWSE